MSGFSLATGANASRDHASLLVAGDGSTGRKGISGNGFSSSHLGKLLSFGAWPGAIAVLALWALNRPYGGITADAILYIGRGLANLDPNGVGRDLLFREDGQSAFSIYPGIVERLIPHLGLGGTGVTLAILGLLAWIAALASLSSALASGRMRWAILVMVALLPFGYGAHAIFSYAEPLAVPRPFAEAAVLAGLAAFIRGRTALAFACLGVAALFHPIMALAGFAVAFLILCVDDKRWLAAGLALLAGLAGAAALGLPLVSRLYAVFDPEWWGILTGRHPYLFPTSWPLEAYTPAIVQLTSVGMAASFTQGRVRAVLLAAIAVSLMGLAAAIILGDWLRLVLIVQMQVWRPVWLVAVLGAASFALSAGELWRRGGPFRLAFAILTVAWAYAQMPGVALGACALAAGMLALARTGRPVSRALLVSAWTSVGVLLAYYETTTAIALAGIVREMPKGAYLRLDYLRSGELQLIPAAFLIAISINRASLRLRPALVGIAGIALITLAVAHWDDRAPMRRLVEAGEPPAGLAQLVGSHGQEMLFLPGRIDPDEPWFWFRSPNWGAEIQGASILFSRPLALFWAKRMHELIDLGLADNSALTPYLTPQRNPFAELTKGAIETLCARADGPTVIVSALRQGTALPSGTEGSVFPLSAPQFALTIGERGLVWHRFDDYAVIRCAAVTAAGR